jgi:hypothetical protein
MKSLPEPEVGRRQHGNPHIWRFEQIAGIVSHMEAHIAAPTFFGANVAGLPKARVLLCELQLRGMKPDAIARLGELQVLRAAPSVQPNGDSSDSRRLIMRKPPGRTALALW